MAKFPLDFFAKLEGLQQASSRSMMCFLENGDSVAAQFEYDWTLTSGDKILFQGRLFQFGPSGKFASMSIFYDTYPTREGFGDKYG